ncbi:MAG: hypothetical protein INF63_05595 [Roseomonas sp.]|nr:hypothetical protein [Roseomonas sp.]
MAQLLPHQSVFSILKAAGLLDRLKRGEQCEFEGMARRSTLGSSLDEINSRDQELKEGLSPDGVLYFAAPDDAVSSPDFYDTGLGLQPWPMVPAGWGTYVALSPHVLMGASRAVPAMVAQGQDAAAPMPQGAEGPAMLSITHISDGAFALSESFVILFVTPIRGGVTDEG